MEKKDDRFIVEQLKLGSEYGFRLFVRKYQAMLLGLALRVYHTPRVIAEELIEDTFLKAINAIASFDVREEGCLGKWLHFILKNSLLDYQRKEANKKNKVELYQFNESDHENMESSSSTSSIAAEIQTRLLNSFLGENFTQDQRVQLIYDVMNTFGAEDQLILWDHFQETDNKEIAAMRGSTEGAARKQVNRLVHLFFQRVGEKTGTDWRQMHERWKERNR